MIPLLNNNELCKHRRGEKCMNEQIAKGMIVNGSMQSRWYCSNCKYFEPTQ